MTSESDPRKPHAVYSDQVASLAVLCAERVEEIRDKIVESFVLEHPRERREQLNHYCTEIACDISSTLNWITRRHGLSTSENLKVRLFTFLENCAGCSQRQIPECAGGELQVGQFDEVSLGCEELLGLWVASVKFGEEVRGWADEIEACSRPNNPNVTFPIESEMVHSSMDEPPAKYRRDQEVGGTPCGPVTGSKTALGFSLHTDNSRSDRGYRDHFKTQLERGTIWARSCKSGREIEMFLVSRKEQKRCDRRLTTRRPDEPTTDSEKLADENG
jgi:hypothetical protein